MLFQRKSKPLLGLDISTSSVKLIEIAQSGKNYKVECFAAEPMPPNAITDKVIADVDAAGDAIRRVVKRSGSRTKHAAVAIGGASVRGHFWVTPKQRPHNVTPISRTIR